ncbi:MAG: sigma-54 dependent transcriptional regulator [Candidatus Sungbacteria bacterium]|nr:sigma-54 dependent transcriptional regulator [bacterium]MDZ4285374.1 sigma-54 dependent transcriptional regulator [Candidatus Sungbacteria bacterium]
MDSQETNLWRDVLGDAWALMSGQLPSIISRSEVMRKMATSVVSVARVDSTVLFCGESGTGKDLLARAIHALSSRAGKNYVALNCAAITESLFESELFGHERGAFTGAYKQKIGMWEEADAGTLFLDEIGDMPFTVQAKVLRAMENRRIRRVGSAREVPVNVRIVAATNRDLEQMVNESQFRRDLYYRINVVTMTVPPLRERKEDIPLLFDYFLQAMAQKMGRAVPRVSSDVVFSLIQYKWPGNIRELQNLVERALAITSGVDELTGEHFPILCEHTRIGTLSEMMEEFEADVIRRTLIETHGNQTWAAKRLGVHRNAIVQKVNRYRLRDFYPELFHYHRRKE